MDTGNLTARQALILGAVFIAMGIGLGILLHEEKPAAPAPAAANPSRTVKEAPQPEPQRASEPSTPRDSARTVAIRELVESLIGTKTTDPITHASYDSKRSQVYIWAVDVGQGIDQLAEGVCRRLKSEGLSEDVVVVAWWARGALNPDMPDGSAFCEPQTGEKAR